MPKQLRILFVTMVNCGGSDRIVAAMGRQGAECAVLGAPGWFATRSRFATTLFPIPASAPVWWHSLRLKARLDRILASWRPEIVIPLDDFSARVLRDPGFLRRAGPGIRALIARSLGTEFGYATACSRHRLIGLARHLGLAVPNEEAVATLAAAKEAASRFGFPVVLKRNSTSGGSGVSIVADEAGLTAAFRQADRKVSLKRILRWIPGFASAQGEDLILQSHVPGPLAFTTAACVDGVVFDAISFVSERSHPDVTGASTVIRPIERADLLEAARTLVAALGCSGIVSFDFILPPEGPAVLIEMNARPTASGHLGRLFGHDIYTSLLERLGGRPAAWSEVPCPPQAIALFPRELDRDPRSPLLDDPGQVLHDVPWDDRGVIPAYLASLERRHPNDRRLIRQRLADGREDSLPHTGFAKHATRPRQELALAS